MSRWITDPVTQASRLLDGQDVKGMAWRTADGLWRAQAAYSIARVLGPFTDEPEARAALLDDLKGVRR